MRPLSLCAPLTWLVLAFATTVATAQEYKVEPSKDAPPAGISDAVKGALGGEAFKVVDGDGKVYAEVWLRKAVPASEKPAGPKGAVLYPFLAEGEMLGVLRFPAEGHDYRDQTIPKGVYTLRYGLQPVNGDHLGVSVNRDYALLLPAAKDKDLAPLAQKPLQERSAESAGASHPGVLMLLAAPAGAKPPAVARDEEKNLWGVVMPLNLEVKGAGASPPFNVQLVVVGAAAV